MFKIDECDEEHEEHNPFDQSRNSSFATFSRRGATKRSDGTPKTDASNTEDKEMTVLEKIN